MASKLLTPTLGMASGCALLVDYVLTISLSVASGTDSLFSSLPEAFQPFKRVRESVLTLTPIFLLFLLTHVVAVVWAVAAHVPEVGALAARTAIDIRQTTTELGSFGVLFLILRACSMGAGTFTGIEAVSNAMPILREPRVATAKITMRGGADRVSQRPPRAVLHVHGPLVPAAVQPPERAGADTSYRTSPSSSSTQAPSPSA